MLMEARASTLNIGVEEYIQADVRVNCQLGEVRRG
jgi:hypothetical protein